LSGSSHSCLKCGDKAGTSGKGSASAVITVPMLCLSCGSELPAGSQFCLQCGHSAAATASNGPTPALALPPTRRHLRGKPRMAIWLLLPPLLLAGIWAGISDDPSAEQVRGFVNPAHVETLMPASVDIKARSFGFYRFTVPRGATNVGVSGQFSATGEREDNVEVYVVADAAFVSWQYGYAPDAYYSSGRVSQGKIDADLPSGAGAYYLVFNNKFSPRAAKTVQASVTLHYQNWWPLR
jgi:hypothetical protein